MAKRKKPSDKQITEKEIESGERVSGEPDSNLSAVGGGGIAGAVVGGAIGTAVGGPVGGVIGAAAGAIAGGAAAEKVSDELDPKVEEVYWRENYPTRPYFSEDDKYENYLPAYRYGWECAMRKENWERDFSDAEHDLKHGWEKEHADLGVWERVREAVKDSYERIRERRLAGSVSRR